MTFSVLGVQGGETLKTRWRAVPYTGGKGLDLGCGKEKLFDTEFCTGVDNGKDTELFGHVVNPNIKADVSDLSQFATGKQDYVFSSHVLEHFHYKDVPNILREWMRVIRTDGHLCLYLPDADQYPQCAEPDAGIHHHDPASNSDHKWNVTYDKVVAAMAKTAFNWDLVDYEVCKANDEYSLWFVFKKLK